MSKKAFYPFIAYYKQGDDLMQYYQETNGNLPKALLNWAEALKGTAERLTQLAGIMQEAQVEDVSGGASCIRIVADEASVKRVLEADIGALDESYEDDVEENEMDKYIDELIDGNPDDKS